MRKPRAPSSSAPCTGVLPPSTMLASSGTRLREARAGGVHLLGRAQRLDEQRVDAAVQVGLGAVERRVQAFDGQRIGARQDQRVACCARVERGAQLAAHLGHRHHASCRRGGRSAWGRSGPRAGSSRRRRARSRAPCAARSAHCRSRCRRRRSPAARTRSVMRASVSSHLAEGGQADVGAAQPGVGDRRARQVQRLEAGLLGDQRRQRVVDARGQQHPRLRPAAVSGSSSCSSSSWRCARRCSRRPPR